MGQIIKQPNGKFAVWSRNVDNFLCLNMTPDDLVDYFIKKATEGVRENVMKKVDMLNKGVKPYHQFTMSFEEALSYIKDIHGTKEYQEIIKLLTNRS